MAARLAKSPRSITLNFGPLIETTVSRRGARALLQRVPYCDLLCVLEHIRLAARCCHLGLKYACSLCA